MEQFKFKLEKYAGRSTRHECPACNMQQVFARYIDEQGNYIADNVGRCNREDKCGYHLTPSEYFKDKGLNYIPIVNIKPKPLPPIDYIPTEIMKQSLKTDNFFLIFLSKYFRLSELAETVNRYRIGDNENGRVIFWQIDERDRVRTGKIMLYNPDTGRRVKNQQGAFNWAHRQIKEPYTLKQCLFGLHLINRTDKPIAVVESEKSAIIASLVIPEYTWMATGGKSNFRLMEVLRGRDVTVFPDLGAFKEWSNHADKYGFRISRLLEDIANDEDRANGFDIADYILREKAKSK